MNKAVFIDRDGTISEEIGYIRAGDLPQYRLIPGSAGAIQKLRQAGFKALVATNQSGLARGYYTIQEMEAVHVRLKELLAAEKTAVDGIYFCPHHPEPGPGSVPELVQDCNCRKPKPGMGLQAAKEWDLDLKQCWVIGDKGSDMGLARAVGARCVLVMTGYGRESLAKMKAQGRAPDFTAENLSDAAAIILKNA